MCLVFGHNTQHWGSTTGREPAIVGLLAKRRCVPHSVWIIVELYLFGCETLCFNDRLLWLYNFYILNCDNLKTVSSMNSFRCWIQIAQFFPLSVIHRKYSCGEKQDNVVNKQLLSFNMVNKDLIKCKSQWPSWWSKNGDILSHKLLSLYRYIGKNIHAF